MSFLWLRKVFKFSNGLPTDLSKLRIENPEFKNLEGRLVKAAILLIFYILFVILGYMIYFLVI
ncbi:hypothetical protein LEP1GSC196_2947 [Leptospira meyeri serovar Semaranga str. Veldrot Semarang 173]|nr:hypothetical protein LEP1GSC196_2947 [Leptospira meyeri serovar Semaranga str. Veldrot Semarang 173]